MDSTLVKESSELILLVDDGRSIREVTSNTLEVNRYRVRVANDGTAAISLFADHPQEVALLVVA